MPADRRLAPDRGDRLGELRAGLGAWLARRGGRAAARRGRGGARLRRPGRSDGGGLAGAPRRPAATVIGIIPSRLAEHANDALHPCRRHRDRPRPQPRGGRLRRGGDRDRRRVGDAVRDRLRPPAGADRSSRCESWRPVGEGPMAEAPGDRPRRDPGEAVRAALDAATARREPQRRPQLVAGDDAAAATGAAAIISRRERPGAAARDRRAEVVRRPRAARPSLSGAPRRSRSAGSTSAKTSTTGARSGDPARRAASPKRRVQGSPLPWRLRPGLAVAARDVGVDLERRSRAPRRAGLDLASSSWSSSVAVAQARSRSAAGRVGGREHHAVADGEARSGRG